MKNQYRNERLSRIKFIKEKCKFPHDQVIANLLWTSIAKNASGFVYTFSMSSTGHIAIHFASAGIKNIYGKRAEDVMYDFSLLAKLIHPDDIASFNAAVVESARTMMPFQLEFRVLNPDKGELWVEVSSVPRRLPENKTIWYGITLDITKYKRTELSLAASVRELAFLSESLPGVAGYLHRYPDGSIHISYASSNIVELFGLRLEDVVDDAKLLLTIVHPDDMQHVSQSIKESARTMTLWREEYRIIHPISGVRWMEAYARPDLHSDGSVVWYAYIYDITEHKLTEHLLRKREQEFRTLSDNSPDVVVRYDRECRRIYVNPKHVTTTGLSTEASLGKTPIELWGVGATISAATYQKILQGVLDSGQSTTIELDWHNMDGKRSCFSMSLVAERDQYDQIVSVLTISRDTLAIKQAQESLSKREHEFRALVEHSPDTIARYDRTYQRIYANPQMVADMGGDLTRILGTTPSQFPGGTSAIEYESMLHQVFEFGEERQFELRWNTVKVEFCSHIKMIPEFDDFGRVSHVLAVGRDITEIDRYRQKIHQQAFFDSLTGLPNRQFLSDRINQTIADASRHGRQFGVILLDLDHFKEVNDTLGHGVGDQLLCETAKRMQESIRAYDTVARLGGDEFSILLPDLRKGDDVAMISGKILHELAKPFLINEQEVFVTCSIGISLYPDDSTDLDTLYKYADSAMYHAKKMGRNNFQFYAKEFTAHSLNRIEIETALRKARKNNELMLHYQPKVELQSGRITGAEALLRWFRPGQSIVMPDQFISIAEDSGLIVEIGEWVLRTVCMVSADWNRTRKNPITVAANLSPRQFVRNDLIGLIRQILKETGCKPEWLELEITESLLLEDGDEVAAQLMTLSEMGIVISIDDFGTGYSALSYLSRFPVSQLKIDRSFVTGVPEQRNKCELVKAMLSIANALSLESVAEGVESREQVSYLIEHGCQLAQGFLFGKPMEKKQFESLFIVNDI